MCLLYLSISAYLSAGLGFALASWLQAAETAVDAGGKPPKFFDSTLICFVLGWWLIARYCYCADVKKDPELKDLAAKIKETK